MSIVKSILIIGNKGQVSQYLQAALKADYRVYATSRDDVDLVNTDAIQMSLKALLKQYSPAVIINPAAYTAVDLAEQEQELTNIINAKAVAEIGQFCADVDIPVIHFSTDYVFDGNASIAYEEGDETIPNSVYGKTKLAGEQALIKSQAPAVILRTAWVYSNQGKNFYNTMLNLAETRDTLSVVHDQVGAPTYAGSIASGVKELVDVFIRQGNIHLEQQGVYNFTCQGQTSWSGFAKRIFESHNLKITVSDIPSSEYPTPAKRPAFSVLDGSKLKSVFGITLPSWEVALNDCVAETRSILKKPNPTSAT